MKLRYTIVIGLASFASIISLYLYINWNNVTEASNLIANNTDSLWLWGLISVTILNLMYVFFTERKYDRIVFSISLMTIAGLTFGIYFTSFYYDIFVPNGPIPGVFASGDQTLAAFGLLLLYISGFCISLLVSKRLFLSFVIGLPAGAGIVATEMLCLGLLDLLYFPITLILSATVSSCLLCFAFRELEPLTSHSFKNITFRITELRWTLLPLGGVVALALVELYQALAYPPTEWDSLAYGVNYAALIFAHHGIPLISGPSVGIEISANYPPGTQLLAAYFYSLAGGPFDLYYRLLSPIFSIALLFLIYYCGSSLFGHSKYGILAALCLAAFPLFWSFGTLTSYIIFTTMEFGMLTLALILWFKSQERRFLVIAGLACGFASLTSYIGFITFLLPISALLWQEKSVKCLKKILITLLSGGISIIWLIRNLYLLHNPFYPMAGLGANLVSPLIQSTQAQIKSDFQLNSLNVFLDFFLRQGNLTAGPVFVMIVICLPLAALTLRRQGKDTPRLKFILGLFLFSIVGFTAIVYLNGFFIRYLTIFLPSFALSFVLLYRMLEESLPRYAPKLVMITLVLGLVVSSALAETSGAVPNSGIASQASYISAYYGNDAQAWNWINTNTPSGSVIATYEIRTYYIHRPVVPLDGNNMLGLYTSNLSESGVFALLRQYNVSYILSVDWASAISTNAPPAYHESSLTKYLGDPQYFPTVYANAGAAIYKVGGNASSDLFVQPYSEIPLSLNQVLKVPMTNKTTPWTSMIYLAIPPDFQNDLISISAKFSYEASVELWNGFIPENDSTGWWAKYECIARSPELSASMPLGTVNPALVATARSGLYTLVLADWAKSFVPANATIDVSLLPTYRLQDMLVRVSPLSYLQTALTENGSGYSVLYYNFTSSGIANVSLTQLESYSAFSVYNTTVPFNGYADWNSSYTTDLIATQSPFGPSLEPPPASIEFPVHQGLIYSFVFFSPSGTSGPSGAISLDLSSSYSSAENPKLSIFQRGSWTIVFQNGNYYYVAERNQTTYSDFVVESINYSLANTSLRVVYQDKGVGPISFFAVVNSSWVNLLSLNLTNTGRILGATLNIEASDVQSIGKSEQVYIVVDTYDNPFSILYVEPSS